jgi:hypothetical protein
MEVGRLAAWLTSVGLDDPSEEKSLEVNARSCTRCQAPTETPPRPGVRTSYLSS